MSLRLGFLNISVGMGTWQLFLWSWACWHRGSRLPCVGKSVTLLVCLRTEVDALTKELEDFELKKAAARAVTGVLASHPNSTDVHIINLSLTFHGQELLSDTKLELNSGRRYGLIGLNGIGKRWWRLERGDSVSPRSWADAGGKCCRLEAVRQTWRFPFSHLLAQEEELLRLLPEV